MNLRTALVEAIASLRFYRRRTLVTVSSLAWGVACFLLLMSLGSGYDTALRTAFQAVGQDLIVTGDGQTSLQAGGLRAGRHILLDRTDLDVLREAAALVGPMSPEKFTGERTVVYGHREKRYLLRGVNPEYRQIRNMDVTAGRWISYEDVLHRNRVAVLGATVARELFSSIPPEGQEITAGGLRFTVVGVLEPKGQLANYHRYDNDSIFIPYDTASVFVDIRHPDLIVWTPVSGTVRKQAVQEMRTILAGIHRFSPNDTKAVEILAFNDFLYVIDAMTISVKVLLAFIGTLTLGIGGVGLANIMLASVVERTREIGVLKALGGRRRSVLSQFLIEALLIIATGGLLGTLLGAAGVLSIGSISLLGPLFRDAAEKGDLHLTISAASVLLSTGVLLAVGLVAGLVPAIKAARLDPIEALRYE